VELDYTLDAKRKKELKDTLDEVYCKIKCEIHQEEYCLTIYGNNPEKHVFLTESMLKVWASYIVSNINNFYNNYYYIIKKLIDFFVLIMGR